LGADIRDDQAGGIEEASGVVGSGDGDASGASDPSAGTIGAERARWFSSTVVGGETDRLLALVSSLVPDALGVLPARFGIEVTT